MLDQQQLIACFNSKLVRLKGQIIELEVGKQIGGFNSKLVRLKVMPTTQRSCAGLRFNSKLVRLKVDDDIAFAGRSCFNSKLVRLKGLRDGGTDAEYQFQFQTGAIKSAYPLRQGNPTRTTFQFQTGAIKRGRYRNLCPSHWHAFQFQTGAIKRLSARTGSVRAGRCFNSKLVRLKDRTDVWSHLSEARFNSKLVRLKVADIAIATHPNIAVSIPNWCD